MTKRQQAKNRNYLWWALFGTLLLAAAVQFPALSHPFAVEEDFRTLFWMQRFQEPDLFPNEPLAFWGVREVELGATKLVVESSSPGYSLLFYAASFIVPPLTFSKWLVFPLLLTVVYFIYRIGEQLADPKSALILSLLYATLNLASDTEISVIAGLHRSFVTPFLLALLFYLLNERYKAASFVLFLCGIVYLPIFPVGAMTYLFAVIRLRENGRWHLIVPWRPIIYLVITVILVVWAVFPVIADRLGGAAMASAESALPILQNPEYQTGGRRPLFNLFPFVGRGGFASHRIGSMNIAMLGGTVLLLWLIRRRKMVWLPRPFVSLLSASLVGFTLAWASIILTSSFIFYIPSRHTQSSFFLLALIVVGINLKGVRPVVLQWMATHRRHLLWYALPVILAAFGLATFPPYATALVLGPTMRILLMGLAAVLLVLAFIAARRPKESAPATEQTQTSRTAQWRLTLLFIALFAPPYIFFIGSVRDNLINLSTEDQQLMAYIATLPAASLFGGDPCRLDNVPLYAGRSVLFSCERYQQLKSPETVQAMLVAYYAPTSEQIVQFCQEYGVDYLVVDERTLTDEFIAAGNFFFEPYNRWLSDRLAGQNQFALADVAVADRLFQVGSTFIMPCQAETLNGG